MRRPLLNTLIAIAIVIPLLAADAPSPAVGDFTAQSDIGIVQPAGSATFDRAANKYTVTSSGANVWAKHDDFHFVYRKAPADLTITADVATSADAPGKIAHRKGGLMVREGLDADAPYVDVMVHGDGSIGLQYRTAKGEITTGVKTTLIAPATVRLERHGDTFTASAAPRPADPTARPTADAFKPIGSLTVTLNDPVFVGLAVSAHDAATTETATFSNLTFTEEKAPPAK